MGVMRVMGKPGAYYLKLITPAHYPKLIALKQRPNFEF